MSLILIAKYHRLTKVCKCNIIRTESKLVEELAIITTCQNTQLYEIILCDAH